MDKKNAEGETALTIAVWRGYVGTVEALLKAGSDIELRDRHGYTPLMKAIVYYNVPTVGVLLKY